jgi:hypothetical protein
MLPGIDRGEERMGEEAEILDFTVQGRRGDEYRIAAWRQGNDLMLTCTCPAGVNRRICHHRVALLDGVVDNLVSGNHGDVDRLRSLMRGTRIEPVVARFCHAEREFGPDTWAYDHAKDELVDLLALGYASGGPPGRRRAKSRRSEQLKVEFGPDGRAVGWAFDVSEAFRPALDIAYSQLVDRERTRQARVANPKAPAVQRMAWTRGVPPLFAFERGQVFHEPHGVRGTERAPGGPRWGEALGFLRRTVQVRDAVPDAAPGKPGWVSFEVWTVADNQLGEGAVHRRSQAAFGEFLRTGVLPEE